MHTIDDRLQLARTGDANTIRPLLRTNQERIALYVSWLEAAPRDGKLAARDAVVQLQAQRSGLGRAIVAALSSGSDAAIAARVSKPMQREAAVERFVQAFAALDPVQRDVLWIRDVEQLTEAAASEKLVVSLDVLRQKLGRARDQLRGRLALAVRR